MRSAFRLHARQTKGRILAEIDRRGAQVLRAGAAPEPRAIMRNKAQ